MKDGIYLEVFAVIDDKRHSVKIIGAPEASKILAESVMDGLGKVIGFKEADHSTEKGGAE